MLPDKTGKYASLYRPIHMIGLELGISVASAALRKEPTVGRRRNRILRLNATSLGRQAFSALDSAANNTEQWLGDRKPSGRP